jgi:hypothetical protein
MTDQVRIVLLTCAVIVTIHMQQGSNGVVQAVSCPSVPSSSQESLAKPTCQLEEAAALSSASQQQHQQPMLTLVIRVSHADCTPASAADVTTSLRDKACVGVTSPDGYYVTSLATGGDRWRIVSVRASSGGKGEVETQTIVFVRQVGEKLFVKARGSAGDGFVSISGGKGSNTYTAVVHVVLENETQTER